MEFDLGLNQTTENQAALLPWTGAVVLETKAQYQEAGLRPVDPATVFTVPEPSTWVLLLVGSVTLGRKLWWRRIVRPANQ